MDFESASMDLFDNYFEQTDPLFVQYRLKDVSEYELFNDRVINVGNNNAHCNKCNGNVRNGTVRNMFYVDPQNGQDVFVHYCVRCERIIH